jgi:hypothetical protein
LKGCATIDRQIRQTLLRIKRGRLKRFSGSPIKRPISASRLSAKGRGSLELRFGGEIVTRSTCLLTFHMTVTERHDAIAESAILVFRKTTNPDITEYCTASHTPRGS